MGSTMNCEVIQSVQELVQGSRRERICVACHPNQAALAREVANELLPLMPCEVHLLQSGGAPIDEDEVRLFLREMALVVFIITRDFLFQENDARSIVLPLAKEEHARMLMIQAEPGIETDFDAVCGAYHLLDRASALYGQALSNFVSDHLDMHYLTGLDDEQKRIMQEIFQRRCFISYRKKDRAHLLRLVDAIRRYPGFLDVSLWYDDALVAGEDYNDQIAARLESADCVLFAVTASFLEPGNYVLEHEYPQAMRAGKTLVPVLMEPVDEVALRALYPDFRECVTWGDNEKLVRMLAAAFGGCDPTRCPSPAEKHFLAREYVAGQRTERNMDLAYRLYVEAAEEGYVWAMARLADDYHVGVLLEHDEAKAEFWLEKAVAALRDLMESTEPEASEAVSIGQTLAKMAEELFELRFGRQDTSGAYQMACLFADAAEYLRHAGGVMTRFSGGRADLLKARCSLARGNDQEALQHLDRAAPTLLGLEQMRSPYAVANVAELLANRGRVLLRLERMDHLDWIRDDLSGALERYLYINELNHDNYAGTLLVLSDLLFTAIQFESAWHDANEAAALAQTALAGYVRLMQIAGPGGLDSSMHPDDFDYQYAKALYYAAVLGRIGADAEKLEECQRLVGALCARTAAQPAENLAFRAASAQTLQAVRSRLDMWTTWALLDHDAAQLMQLFASVAVWETDDIPQWGNYVISAYCCPVCGNRLYKTVFPSGNDPVLPTSPGDGRVSPARVFACNHGHFFVAPKGRKIVQGPVYFAQPRGGNPPADLFSWWWRYFDELGDIGARRNE